MNCSRKHHSRMVDYSGIVDGERKLQNAIYQFVLGIRGNRRSPVTKEQIFKWFHGTPSSMVVTAILSLVGDKIIFENGKYRVMTFRDHVKDRELRREIVNEAASVRRFGTPE
jgi:hypothetical protein